MSQPSPTNDNEGKTTRTIANAIDKLFRDETNRELNHGRRFTPPDQIKQPLPADASPPPSRQKHCYRDAPVHRLPAHSAHSAHSKMEFKLQQYLEEKKKTHERREQQRNAWENGGGTCEFIKSPRVRDFIS